MQTGKFPLQEFNETRRLNPFWSDYICFAETIKNRKLLSGRTIKKYFEKLVDKYDYEKSEKHQVLRHLINLSEGTAG